jgi:hypothetical protein
MVRRSTSAVHMEQSLPPAIEARAGRPSAFPGAEKLDLRGIQSCGVDCLVVMSSGPAEQGAANMFRSTDKGKTWQTVWSTDRPGVFLDAIQIGHEEGWGLVTPSMDTSFF